MSKKEHYKYNDLVDAITEDMTPVKALKVKRMLVDIFNYRMPLSVLCGVLAIAITMGICGAVIWVGEIVSPPSEPLDWEQFGIMFIGLACGVALGVMLALDDVIGRIRRRVVKIVEDTIEDTIEGDNS